MLLDLEHFIEERQVLADLAKTAGISISNYLRSLVKAAYKRKKEHNPALFNEIKAGNPLHRKAKEQQGEQLNETQQ